MIGRTFDEYYRMFDLNDELLKKEKILDVASGVSSFCAQARARGYDATASDKIYTSDPSEIEKKCAEDLDVVMKQLPGIADLYIWNYFKNLKALKNNREEAYRSFIEDFKKYGIKRYVPAEFPATNFLNEQFTISLASHFLFVYEDRLDFDFHKKTILELLRITSKEIRIFPIVNLKGKRSKFVEPLIHDEDIAGHRISIRKVGYEFMKNGNQMLVIEKSTNDSRIPEE